MNFKKLVPLVARTPYSPHFLEIAVGSLGGGGECVGTLSFVCAFYHHHPDRPHSPPPPTPSVLPPPSVPHPLLQKFSLKSNLIFPF